MINTEIMEACFTRLQSIGLSPELPIAWSGIGFKPPDTGMWLEAKLFPNEPLDPVWNSDGCYVARGFFQVMVGFRPGVGDVRASMVADAVIAHFPKGSALGPVRVLKTPWQTSSVADGSKLLIPVTVPYRELVS